MLNGNKAFIRDLGSLTFKINSFKKFSNIESGKDNGESIR